MWTAVYIAEHTVTNYYGSNLQLLNMRKPSGQLRGNTQILLKNCMMARVTMSMTVVILLFIDGAVACAIFTSYFSL